MEFETVDKYWDCECKTNYIHSKEVGNFCPICQVVEWDMPDARSNELYLYNTERDKAIHVDRNENDEMLSK